MLSINIFLSLFLLLSGSFAHPGHDVSEEAAERAEYLKRNPRSVRSCAQQLKARGHQAAALQRRQDLFQSVQKKRHLAQRSITPRDFATYNISHLSTDVSPKSMFNHTGIFNDDSSCVLQPEVTQGPYYVNGELIRNNVIEEQDGVPMVLDIQLVDTSTCDPVPDMFVDLWHCNSTGVYSGVMANGNGNSDDSTNLDSTFLRGIQRSSSSGVVQFMTLMPGHYTGKLPYLPADNQFLIESQDEQHTSTF